MHKEMAQEKEEKVLKVTSRGKSVFAAAGLTIMFVGAFQLLMVFVHCLRTRPEAVNPLLLSLLMISLGWHLVRAAEG